MRKAIILSLIYPAVSLLLFALGYSLIALGYWSSYSPPIGAGYCLAAIPFLLNYPGVLIMEQLPVFDCLNYNSDGFLQFFLGVFPGVFFTWLIIPLPICFLAACYVIGWNRLPKN